MRIDVHSRKQFEDMGARPNVWVISIHTPGDAPAANRPHWEKLERFCFSDIAGDSVEMMLWAKELRDEGREVVFFSVEMAQRIREIVKQAHLHGKDLVIHCDAGVSRSQAVARWVRQVYGADVVSHTVGHDHHANGLVLRHLMWLEWQEAYKDTGTFTVERDDDHWRQD